MLLSSRCWLTKGLANTHTHCVRGEKMSLIVHGVARALLAEEVLV